MPEFEIVYQYIKGLPAQERQDFIWDKIIYANPIKANETLRELDRYKPLVTYDNHEEIRKIRKHAPHAGLALRLRVPNTGAMVELSSKFGAASGEAVELIEAAPQARLVVEGLSFHVGSQTTNFENYVQALQPGGRRVPRGGRPRLPTEAGRHRRRLSRPLRLPGPALQDAGQADQRRAGPAVPQGHRNSGRAGPVPRGHRRHGRRQGDRQGRSATANAATTSTTASTTPTPASSSTTASTT